MIRGSGDDGTVACGHADAIGAPGAGGSLGYADPSIGLGYGCVTSCIGPGVEPDPRDVALRETLAAALA